MPLEKEGKQTGEAAAPATEQNVNVFLDKIRDFRTALQGFENTKKTPAEQAAYRNIKSGLDKAGKALSFPQRFLFPERAEKAKRELRDLEGEITIYAKMTEYKQSAGDTGSLKEYLGTEVKEHLDNLMNQVFDELAKGDVEGAKTALDFYRDDGKIIFRVAEDQMRTEGSEGIVGQKAKNTLDEMAKEICEQVKLGKTMDAEDALKHYEELQKVAHMLGEKKQQLVGISKQDRNKLTKAVDEGLDAVAARNLRKSQSLLNEVIESGKESFRAIERKL